MRPDCLNADWRRAERQRVVDGREHRHPAVQAADPQDLRDRRLRRDEAETAPNRVGLVGNPDEIAEPAGVTEGQGLARVGPLGEVPGVSKLVEVHVLDVVTRGESAVLAPRWQATGPGGGLFPALDADIWLTPAGEGSARLSLAGVYRPPLGALGAGLDRAVFHRVADATARSLLARVADVLAAAPQDPADTGPGTGTGGGAAGRAASGTP